MKIKLSICLLACLLLAGCAQETTSSDVDLKALAKEEISNSLNSFSQFINTDGRAEALLEVARSGASNDLINFTYSDLYMYDTGLTDAFKPVPDSFQYGYDWDDGTFTWVLRAETDAADSCFVVAEFDKDFNCVNCRAAGFNSAPDLEFNTSTSMISADIDSSQYGHQLPEGYNPYENGYSAEFTSSEVE